MDAQRAQEIIDSPTMINVTLEGTPIYIQTVNQQDATARVFPVNNPENTREVSLHDLNEQ